MSAYFNVAFFLLTSTTSVLTISSPSSSFTIFSWTTGSGIGGAISPFFNFGGFFTFSWKTIFGPSYTFNLLLAEQKSIFFIFLNSPKLTALPKIIK